MQRPVLVTLDGSEKDGRALAVARAVAELADAGVHFIRVVADAPEDLAGRPVAPGLRAAAEKEHAEAESALAAAQATLSHRAEKPATVSLLHARDVAAAITKEAAERDALMIVMATRSPSAAARAIAGSVADRVMRESPRPVVLVPPGAAFLSGKEPRITRVLVPLDDSSLALRSLEFLIALPNAKALSYVMVEVIGHERERRAAEARLATNAAWLRSRGVSAVETLVTQADNAPEAIIRTVREVFPDAIAMSTRGAGGLGRLVIGSVAEGVVRRSELPVLLLTPRVLAGDST